LAVDTKAYVPTFEITDKASGATVDSRTYFDLPHSAFVVGMVAMNKGWVLDRKGFSEAFYAFGEFRRRHPEAVLFCHTDKIGADGISLTELAFDAGIPANALVFSNQYAYTLGFSTEMMAAAYSSMDVLLCPSHGEGFGVPMIEAQACGTPVIASNATAQAELVGPGWLVDGHETPTTARSLAVSGHSVWWRGVGFAWARWGRETVPMKIIEACQPIANGSARCQ
jgi:glycosyltransferase involved in cell wall biosynthesis